MPAASAFDLPALARGLPAGAVLPGLAAAFARDAAPRLVVEAPPGSGKTTVVPPAIACHASGRVVVAEPRRLAARAAAARLASLTGTRVGDLAGYAVRGERRVSPAARVVFVTNGLLVRRLLADPELAGVSAVVIDEVHERGLDGDLAFALSDEVARLRDDLTLAVMSATLDADRWAGLLGDDARVLRVPARPHPLRTVWVPPPDGVARLDDRGVTRAFLTHVAATIEHALAAHPEGSLLAFLPGRREVDAVVGLLRGRGIDARPLHGSMSSAEQDAALAEPPGGERRVIVATAIAESSLTVPGVHIVVDAGLAREPRLDRRRGIAGLVTVPASQASVAQRAGRAARLGPGVAVHCCAERELALAPAEARPEIATGDLTGLALALAAWGDPDAADLRLPDRPPAAALETARGTLAALGALARDDAGRVRITARGRALARVPAHPRLARALLDAAERIGPERAAELVAALDADLRAPGGDLAALLRELRRGGTPAARRWRRDVRRLARLVPGGRRDGNDGPRAHTGGPGPGDVDRLPDDAALGLVTGLAHPERIARRREGSIGEYALASGTAAALPRGSALSEAEWLAVADVARARTASASGAVIRAAVPIDRAIVKTAGAALLRDETETAWRDGRVRAWRVRRLGALELARTPTSPDPAAARAAVRALLRGEPPEAAPLGILVWTPAAARLRARLALLHRSLGDPWPAMDDASLAARVDDWLGPEIDRLAAGRPASALDLGDALRRLLPWPAAARLDELAPERITVPSGSAVRVDYPDPADPATPPVLAVKLQECFGWTRTPRVADGRVPVQLQLLSPARRPVAITMDLASFWQEGYRQARAELRGRYPRHPWPEDPRTATPTRGTKRRSG